MLSNEFMENKITDFFNRVKEEEIEIYNEFSLQHELGVFLREELRKEFPGLKLKVQFERNISFFAFDKDKDEFKKGGKGKDHYVKKEIDLVVLSENNKPECAIELKFPKGEHPDNMYNCCKDINFLEQLLSGKYLQSEFKSAYFIAVADDKLFYSGKYDRLPSVYHYFRSKKKISGEIKNPQKLAKGKKVNIKGSYIADWQDIVGTTKYLFLPIKIK